MGLIVDEHEFMLIEFMHELDKWTVQASNIQDQIVICCIEKES